MGYERQINSNLNCYMSLYGVSVTIRVTGCWLPPLGCTEQDLIIHEGNKACWCMLLLNCIRYVDIDQQEHLWCLTDIFHWWKRCMLNDCKVGTHFHKYWILLQQPGWYIPHALCYNCVCCAIPLLRINLCWATSAILNVMRSEITWLHEMVYHTIIWWWCPSWDCMMHTQHLPFFCLLFH